jgi:hypothetical protein
MWGAEKNWVQHLKHWDWNLIADWVLLPELPQTSSAQGP